MKPGLCKEILSQKAKINKQANKQKVWYTLGKHFTTGLCIPSAQGNWFLKVKPAGLVAWGHFLKEGPSSEF